jgi:hypothetical protein
MRDDALFPVDVATASPPFHALIDSGALITNLSNEDVARFLLENGLAGLNFCFQHLHRLALAYDIIKMLLVQLLNSFIFRLPRF